MLYPWVVLEGVDGAGKTTYAKRLVAKASRPVLYHHTGPPGQGGSFHEMARDWWKMRSDCVVLDRAHLDESVYRDAIGLKLAEWNILEGILLAHETRCILLDLPRSLSGDASLEWEHSLFEIASARSHLLWYRVNRLDLRLTDFKTPSFACAEGLGTLTPTWWLIGEQTSTRAWTGVPFSTTSGLTLLWPWINIHNTFVSNVLTTRDSLVMGQRGELSELRRHELTELWSMLGRPIVICLGEVAYRCMSRLGVKPYVCVSHPQFVWRFTHGATTSWAEGLRELLYGNERTGITELGKHIRAIGTTRFREGKRTTVSSG